MTVDSESISIVVIKECKEVFKGLKSLQVDVGGGTGAMAGAMNDNLDFLEGDMFEAIPSADAVLLKDQRIAAARGNPSFVSRNFTSVLRQELHITSISVKKGIC
ncbi:hypothetical protein EZV62_020340 [Acer yangbiense]|uniref:O-methyltransferase domain-containing protein n=1 Tax=Acer yangbiense TaxID=1000413 RepID=A0A5C7HDK9_9ROSI|nr:hypothetical protein EZV62_020340 [Acer yangbiense]